MKNFPLESKSHNIRSPRKPVSRKTTYYVGNFLLPSREAVDALVLSQNSQNIWNLSAQVLSGGTIPTDARTIELILNDLLNRKQIIDTQANPTYSQKISDVIIRLEKAREEITRQQKYNEINNEISQRKHAAEYLSDTLSQQIESERNSLKILLNKQFKQMCDRQDLESQQLEEEWTSDARKRRYSHSSAHLRELIRQSEVMFYEGKINEYNKLKIQAEDLEAIEIDAAYKQWSSDFNRARALLSEKHKNECRAHEKLASEHIAALNAKGQRKAQVIENRKKAIETRRTVHLGNTKLQIRAPKTARIPKRTTPKFLSLPPLKYQHQKSS